MGFSPIPFSATRAAALFLNCTTSSETARQHRECGPTPVHPISAISSYGTMQRYYNLCIETPPATGGNSASATALIPSRNIFCHIQIQFCHTKPPIAIRAGLRIACNYGKTSHGRCQAKRADCWRERVRRSEASQLSALYRKAVQCTRSTGLDIAREQDQNAPENTQKPFAPHRNQ